MNISMLRSIELNQKHILQLQGHVCTPRNDNLSFHCHKFNTLNANKESEAPLN